MHGLYGFMTAAIIIANIQVFKIIDTPLTHDPIAMGTALMSLTFVVTDFLTERASIKAAQKAIYLGFFNYFLFTILLWISVSTPLSQEASPFQQTLQTSLKTLFMPTPGIFLASLIAYITSQFLDVYVFAYLKRSWQDKGLALRSFFSSALAAFLDNFVFSILAWIVFHPHPLPFEIVWQTFVLGGFVMRLIFTSLNAPLILALRYIHDRSPHV